MCAGRGSSESQCVFEAVEVAEMFLKPDLVWVASDSAAAFQLDPAVDPVPDSDAGPTGLTD